MSRRLDTTRTTPDILDCIANLSSDEVFTPPRLVNQMLDLLPKDVWTNPDLKWLDPGCKTGVFLREIAKRLMDQLGEAIPDEDARRVHIYKNMLYGLPITELTSMLSRRSVYYSKDADSERYAVVRMGSREGNIPLVPTKHSFKAGSCIQCGAPESLERGETRENYAYPFIHPEQLPKEFKDMKFDVIVGNPPYQMSGGGGGTNAASIYHLFVQAAIEMDPRYIVMITPSRWFAGGRGLGEYRAAMLADRRISTLVDYPNASDCFPGVDITGGVSYFLWDRSYQGDCSVSTVVGSSRTDPVLRRLDQDDIFIRQNEALPILEKVRSAGEPSIKVSSDTPFGLATNYNGVDEESEFDSVRLYRRGSTAWTSSQSVTKNKDWISAPKVLIPKANGSSGIPSQVTGKPIVAEPNSVCTQTYLVARLCDSTSEAENFASYMRTRFFRFLVSLRKITQDNMHSTFSFVPDIPMDVAWTDEMLFERYGLSEDEILLVKTQIKEMP
jgi:site-specific DNA-methyltransferase (adenine-specific)